MIETSPFQIDSPVLFSVLVLLALFSHIYPKYFQIYFEAFLAIDQPSWKHFGGYYEAYYTTHQELLRLVKQDPEADPYSDEHLNSSAISRVRHELQDQERMLFKYPQIFFDRYEYGQSKPHRLVIPPRATSRGVYAKGRISAATAKTIAGSLPTILVFGVWFLIIILLGFNYSIYSIHDYSAGLKPIPQTTSTEFGFLSALKDFFVGLLYHVLMVIPNLVLRSASTFLGLYWILFQLFDCVFWLVL